VEVGVLVEDGTVQTRYMSQQYGGITFLDDVPEDFTEPAVTAVAAPAAEPDTLAR
jgi:hypothetical protein